MFDARKAKLLQPGERLLIEECPGLRLEVSASRRSWVYRYKSPVDGMMRQVKLGEWPAMSFPSAIAAWERRRAERAAGVDVTAAKRAARAAARAEATAARSTAAYTVRKVCAEYLDGHVRQQRQDRGRRAIELIFNRMLGDLGDMPAAALTRAQAFDLIASHASVPTEARKLRSALGGAWEHALDAGRLPPGSVNWWRQVLIGKLRSRGRLVAGERATGGRHLSIEEVRELVGWLPNFSPMVADVLTLYLWTGARGAEIVGIEAAEVRQEPDGWWWTVPKARTKNARHAGATDLRVPLVGRAADVVCRRLSELRAGPLFPSNRTGASVVQKSIGNAVLWHQPYNSDKPELERLRLPVTHWTPHDLRRTVRTGLAALGCPSEVAEAVLGHMPPGIVGVYDRHRYDAERRLWLSRWSERIS